MQHILLTKILWERGWAHAPKDSNLDLKVRSTPLARSQPIPPFMSIYLWCPAWLFSMEINRENCVLGLIGPKC